MYLSIQQIAFSEIRELLETTLKVRQDASDLNDIVFLDRKAILRVIFFHNRRGEVRVASDRRVKINLGFLQVIRK